MLCFLLAVKCGHIGDYVTPLQLRDKLSLLKIFETEKIFYKDIVGDKILEV